MSPKQSSIAHAARRIGMYLAVGVTLTTLPLQSQQCTTQSQMQATDKAALVQAALQIVQQIQRDDTSGVQASTVPQYAKDFSGIAGTIHNVAPHLAGTTLQPSSLWILDASRGNNGSDGSPQDTQFFCNLNKSTAETSFMIRSLPQGRYALAIVNADRASDPWQIAMLLRQATTGTWQLAGLFPRATTAAGHDGLYYWRAARTAAANKHGWTAWIDYRQAEQLLKPVGFIGSSHLDQLRDEQAKAAPAALSAGIGRDTPLVLKAKDGTEYQITSLGPDSSLGGDRIDVAMHFTTEPIADPVAARTRNRKAAAALLAAYPELRDAFHGVWVFADSTNAAPFASEEAMAQIP